MNSAAGKQLSRLSHVNRYTVGDKYCPAKTFRSSLPATTDQQQRTPQPNEQRPSTYLGLVVEAQRVRPRIHRSSHTPSKARAPGCGTGQVCEQEFVSAGEGALTLLVLLRFGLEGVVWVWSITTGFVWPRVRYRVVGRIRDVWRRVCHLQLLCFGTCRGRADRPKYGIDRELDLAFCIGTLCHRDWRCAPKAERLLTCVAYQERTTRCATHLMYRSS